jgi:2-oxoisovalerate dehydrogenase E1 component
VPKTRALLLEAGVCTEGQLADIDEAARVEVETAIAKAMTSQVTPVQETLLDVYADPDTPPRRGYYPRRAAESDPTGETKTISMAEAVLSAQDTAMGQDETVFLLGEDVHEPTGGVFGTSRGLQTKYGKQRIRPTPIAEQSIIGAGIGSALVGLRPIAEIMFVDFAAVCMDQIANHAAKQRYMSGAATHVPMTIRMMVGGGMAASARSTPSRSKPG